MFPTTDRDETGRSMDGGEVQDCTVRAHPARESTGIKVTLTFAPLKMHGRGLFGTVYLTRIRGTNDEVAIKKIPVDRLTKSRELELLRGMDHPNVVKLLFFYHTQENHSDPVYPDPEYLNLVMEFIPHNLFDILLHHSQLGTVLIQVFSYQILRSLAYIHSYQIFHLDIKPENILVNMDTGVCKLADFGCAKQLRPDEDSQTYICDRQFRASELLFDADADAYTTSTDLRSFGCVLAQLMRGNVIIFDGINTIDQLIKIEQVLGAASKNDDREINPKTFDYPVPKLNPSPCAPNWLNVFPPSSPAEGIKLVKKMVKYSPPGPITPFEAMSQAFFHELREPGTKLPSGADLPPLFNFTESELPRSSSFYKKLIPPQHRQRQSSIGHM